MNTVNQAAFQFAYGTPSSEGYSSSQLSSRHYAGVNPREILNTMSLPALRIHKGTPKMPAKGRKAHRNHLQSYYDPARALQSVLRLKQTLLHLNIIEYIENVPYQPTSGVPLPRDNGHPSSSTVKSLSDVSQWVYLYALLPMQQTLHHTAPGTEGYQWISADGSADDRDLDRKLVRMYHWNTMHMVEVDGVEKHAAPAMIAFVQEPWVLGERDFTNFVRTNSMPQAPRQLTGKERLWAKIYDECTLANCRWFVVTTYYQWTFGCFSEGFGAAFITLDIPSPKPYIPLVTPLQTLYYWLASCMGLPETFVPTPVMESPHSPGLADRSQQAHQRTRNGEYHHSAEFQHSESEASSESEDEYKSTYSRRSHRPESEVSFQSSNQISPTSPGFLRNVHIPAHQHTRGVKIPIAGDQLTKEAVLPRRHWRTDESAERLEMARAQLQQNRSKYETLDWLDEGEWDRWEDGGSYGRPEESVNAITSTMRGVSLRERWVNTKDGTPPSPTLSAVSRDGSAVGGRRGPVGNAVFAVAPKHPRRTFAYQA